MPELPEVETIKETLKPFLCGKTIEQVTVNRPEVIAEPGAAEFVALLRGRRILALERRGKFLLVKLSGSYWLVIHLGMTGRLLWLESGAPQAAHTHLVLRLEGGEVHFVDPRRFGRLYFFSQPRLAEFIDLKDFGPEPLTPEFTPEKLGELLRDRRRPLKALLLDQRLIAGIGNIYADEILFAAGLHPLRPASSLKEKEINALYHSIRKVLAAGIAHGGTTVRDYVDGSGRAGSHQDHLCVYGRAGQGCPACGTLIERRRYAGRSTYFCPRCQV
ncbi:MAG: formamidopyrimidine-DNA glycosylase [Clostridia bacterium]|nr:formamidopyrimidine-DNA glycosylase [Clostridia bacterium]